MVERLTEQVANRMNMALGQYLPKVSILISDFDKLSNRFKNKINLDIAETKEKEIYYANKDDEMKKLNFAINTMKSEIMILKNIAKPEMINLVNKSKEKIKYIEGQIVNIM